MRLFLIVIGSILAIVLAGPLFIDDTIKVTRIKGMVDVFLIFQVFYYQQLFQIQLRK